MCRISMTCCWSCLRSVVLMETLLITWQILVHHMNIANTLTHWNNCMTLWQQNDWNWCIMSFLYWLRETMFFWLPVLHCAIHSWCWSLRNYWRATGRHCVDSFSTFTVVHEQAVLCVVIMWLQKDEIDFSNTNKVNLE